MVANSWTMNCGRVIPLMLPTGRKRFLRFYRYSVKVSTSFRQRDSDPAGKKLLGRHLGRMTIWEGDWGDKKRRRKQQQQQKKRTKWEIKYKFWRYCKSLADALQLNTIIRPPLAGTRWRAGDGKNKPCSVAAVLRPLLQPTTCSFVYSPDSS